MPDSISMEIEMPSGPCLSVTVERWENGWLAESEDAPGIVARAMSPQEAVGELVEHIVRIVLN